MVYLPLLLWLQLVSVVKIPQISEHVATESKKQAKEMVNI